MSIELHNFILELESEKYVQVETQPHHITGLFANLLDTLGRSDCGWEDIYSCYYDCEEDGTTTFYEGEVAESGKPGVWTYKVTKCEPGQEEIITNQDIDGAELTVQLKRMVTEIIATTNVTLLAQSKPESKDIAWREICQNALVEKQRLTLTTYPLTTDDEVEIIFDDIDLPLALIEKLKKEKHSRDAIPDIRLVMTGEPGIGTTTLLQKIAHWIATQTEQDVVIWVSLADLQGRNLEEYLLQKWLKDAFILPVLPEIEEAFISLFNKKRVWLLLDGVHEMAVTGNPLATVAAQIKGWVAEARVVMTCRQSLWNAGKNALSEFDVYRYPGFENPEEVGKFIQRWFAYQPELGKQLLATLAKDKKGQFWDIVRNPLQLTLLCRAWQVRQGDLPKTKAALYGQFIEAFYEAKQEVCSTTSQQQQELNAALGRLAVRGMEQLESPFRFKEDVVRGILGKEKKAFYQLAMQLGWLKVVDVAVENPDESIYAFTHATFQEYFAALVVDNWGYFLPVNLSDGDGKEETSLVEVVEGNLEEAYRVFQPQWREVILLWFGREDVQTEKKEAFVERLVSFDDACGDWNYPAIKKGFYEYRAYFLAAEILCGFKNSSLNKKIASQIIKWRDDNFITQIQECAEALLVETDRKREIFCFSQLLDETSSESNDVSVHDAKDSSEILEINKEEVESLIELFDETDDEDEQIEIAKSLVDIVVKDDTFIENLVHIFSTGDDYVCSTISEDFTFRSDIVGNEKFINRLIELFDATDDGVACIWIADVLAGIARGNEEVINRVIQTLDLCSEDDSDYDEYLLNAAGNLTWAAATAIGNQDAINRLIQLLDESDDFNELIRSEFDNSSRVRAAVVKTLGEISVGNEEAVDSLIQLLDKTGDKETRRNVIEILGKIAVENEEAIERLIELFDETDDEDICQNIIESLTKIGVGNEEAINRLIQLLDKTDYEDTRRSVVEIVGKIAAGHEGAIARFIQLVDEPSEHDTLKLVIESLAKMAEGHEGAIARLTLLLDDNPQQDLLKLVIETLGKMAVGHEGASDRLIQLFTETTDESIRTQIVNSLSKIMATQEQYYKVVVALKDNFTKQIYKNKFDLYQKSYQLVWQCAHHLPYSKFCEAW